MTTPQRRSLDEKDLHPNPLEQLKIWLKDAAEAGIVEPTAMALATASGERPSVRTVLLKAVDGHGLFFYTNYESRKGKELGKNPNAALLFYWNILERQVRVEGTVTKTTPEESFEYFKTRPLLSRIGAWASRQGSVVSSREELEKEFVRFQEKFKDGEVPLPPAWGGYRLLPTQFEFWQGRENRLHDRLCYRKKGDGWLMERLAP